MQYKYVTCKLPSNGKIYSTTSVNLRPKTIFDIKNLLNDPVFYLKSEIDTLQYCIDPEDNVNVYDLVNQDVVYLLYKLRSLSDDVIVLKYKDKEYTKLINQLLDSVKFGRSNAEATFHKLLENMEGLTYRAKVNKIVQILVLCCHAAYIEGDNELPFWDCGQMIKELDEPVENLERWANQKFEQILSIILQHQERNTSQIVKQAIEYIEEQYATEISLEEVAKYVGVTSQHFSKIFKMETGIKYVDWLSELRIERAKEYLMEEKYTVKEICFFVGYRDPNYFSRIFKKMVGVPPSKYREGM
jgi:YesN/AraC family two-component response regulator